MRPRSEEKKKLPQGLYERNGYWSWRDRLTGREHGLGRIPRGDAIAQVREVERHAARARFRSRDDVAPLAVLSREEIVAVATRPVDHSGVYFLICQGEIMYVGQSRYVARRIGEHLMKPHGPFDSFHWIPVPVELLDDTETAYICAFKPPWNRNLGRLPLEK